MKAERPSSRGAVRRSRPRGQGGPDSVYFETFSRGKRSILLDLKSAAGRDVFERLVRTSAAVFDNLRGDLPGKLGLTYEQLKPINPRFVCVWLAGYGTRGPRRADPASEALGQAETGWAALNGETD